MQFLFLCLPYTVTHIVWLDPVQVTESCQSYAYVSGSSLGHIAFLCSEKASTTFLRERLYHIATTCPIISPLQYHWLYSLCFAFYSHDLLNSHLEACISLSPSSILYPPPQLSNNHPFILYIYSSDSAYFPIHFFKIPFMSGIIWYLSFWAWLISLRIMPSGFFYVASHGMISCFSKLYDIPS